MDYSQYIKEIILSLPISKTSYLNNLAVVRHFSKKKKLSISNRVTFFVGENGTGKSTLLEAIAIAAGFNPEGGTKNFLFSTNDSHSELCNHLTLTKTNFPTDGFFLRAESLYNLASYLDKIDGTQNYGGVSLHCQSHGESFLSIIQNRFRGDGIYILDEPEAALSPMRQLTLIAEIDRLVKKNSQFIIATHSPILMAFPKAEILEFSESGIHVVDLINTEHYQITNNFLQNPEKILRYLLND